VDESARRLAVIIDSSDDAIVSKTLEGVITSWNRAAERIFGYTATEAVGQHISLIIPEERHGEEHEVLARLVKGERIDHFETMRHAPGQAGQPGGAGAGGGESRGPNGVGG
jgi:PAS domain S-box-containing protein